MGQAMTKDDLICIQQRLGLSDTKMAACLGVTRQTWRNWRRGCKCPPAMQNAIRWVLELRRIDPANDNIPKHLRWQP
jgi:DNA-binding transcriptional regulator YiaG